MVMQCIFVKGIIVAAEVPKGDVFRMQMHFLGTPVSRTCVLKPDKVALHKLRNYSIHALVSRSAENPDWVAFMQRAWTMVTFASRCLHWAPTVIEASALRAKAWLRVPQCLRLATTAAPHVLR